MANPFDPSPHTVTPRNPFDEDLKRLSATKSVGAGVTVGRSSWPSAPLPDVARRPFASAPSLEARDCSPLSTRSTTSSTASGTWQSTASMDSSAQSKKTGHSSASLQRVDSACAICRSALGKRYMRPRHRCHVCNLSVCSSCAPSFIHVEGEAGQCRVCKSCVQQFSSLPEFKERLVSLGKDLACLGDAPVCAADGAASLRDVVDTCEASVSSMKALREEYEAMRMQCLELRAKSEHAELVKNKTLAELNKVRADWDVERKSWRLFEEEYKEALGEERKSRQDTLERLRTAEQCLQQRPPEQSPEQPPADALPPQQREPPASPRPELRVVRQAPRGKLGDGGCRAELLAQHIAAAAGTVVPPSVEGQETLSTIQLGSSLINELAQSEGQCAVACYEKCAVM